MILEELVLENFGPYAGRQALDLSATSDGSPVILVGGRNGEGKTTILEAVLLALYGPHAQPMIGRSGSYERYLSSRINHAAGPSDPTAVGVTFRVLRGGEEERIRIRRSWHARNKRGAREEIEVWRSGEPDAVLPDGWREFIDALIPRGVAPLFFFDGERIEALADLDAATDTLRTAVGALLGLELVDQLNTDLTALERRHAGEVASTETRTELERTKGALDAAEQSAAQARQGLAGWTAKLERADADARHAEERFRSEGGETYEARSKREAAMEAARSRLDFVLSRLRDLAAGAYPLALVHQTLAGLAMQAREERQAELAGDLLATLSTRDAQAVSWAADAGASEELCANLAVRFQQDRDQRQGAIAVDPLANISPPALRHVEALLEESLPAASKEARRLLDEVVQAHVDLERAEASLAEVPSVDAIGELIAARERATARRDDARTRFDELHADLEARERERDRAAEEHERSLRRAAEEALGDEDSERILRHAQRARGTLLELRRRAAAHHMGRIEALIGDCLGDLLRKEGLVQEVRIDPATYELRLLGRGGRLIDTAELSAGERQLIALSLLWGLARASARNLPVIIDTPLGRLDASHRLHFVSRYLPHASHQVLVLSTDTEVDRELAHQLNGAIASTYRLDHHDETAATEIVPGYFFDEASVA